MDESADPVHTNTPAFPCADQRACADRNVVSIDDARAARNARRLRWLNESTRETS
jgi:hypothetical protein